MEPGLAVTIGIPVALVTIMLGLGLSLRIDDFRQVFARPQALMIGLLCHILLLPGLCFLMLLAFDLPVTMAVGMMLLAASPGGTTAALYTHLARGDVALSLTFAAVTSVVALVSVPLFANFSLAYFAGQGRIVGLDIAQVLQIFALAIVPALAGAVIRSHYVALAERLDRPVKLLATVFLALLIGFALISHWDSAVEWGPVVGAVVLLYNVVSMALGYLVPKWLGVRRAQAVALAMSLTIHNAALVITVAMSEFMLDEPEMAIPPGLYGIIAYVTCAMFIWLLNRKAPKGA